MGWRNFFFVKVVNRKTLALPAFLREISVFIV
jgi:hypothetical protein